MSWAWGKIDLRWMPHLGDEKSTLVQVMPWCHLAPSYHLSRYWSSSVRPYSIIRSQWVNSSPPNAAYMHQWIVSALLQIMACRLYGAKPLSEPMLDYYQLNPGNNFQWNSNQNTKFFSHKNASENIVCKMAAILSKGEMSWFIVAYWHHVTC